MGYRYIDNCREQILKAVLKIGASEGVKQVSAKKIADLCGISDGTVFTYFKTKQDYLDAAARYFDRTYMAQMLALGERGLLLPQIWDAMLDLFLADPEGAMYYNNYTLTFGFDVTARNPRAEEFLGYVKAVLPNDAALSEDVYLVIWDYITSMAFYYAEKFIHGYLPNNEEIRAAIKTLVFSGIDGLTR